MLQNLYRDPSKPIQERVEDLLGRMTTEEKVGQMLQLDARGPDRTKLVHRYLPGSMLCVVGDNAAEVQRAALSTRLGIPLLMGIDAIHGHSMEFGATIYPSQLGLSCAWDLDLCHDIARATAREMAPTGVSWTFSPVLCLPRDLRWGRVGETFGEDPLLISQMGEAMIRGYQGDDLSDSAAVAACAKHFVGYGDTQGGRDASEADHSRRKVRAHFFPPFKAAADVGCATFMVGYEAVDGVPCSANRWLLTDVLRGEWGFEGLVVTDWDNVGRMTWQKCITHDVAEASRVAVDAGNDLIMTTPGFLEGCLSALKAGTVTMAQIDAAVRRILTLKFRLGLFENPRLPEPAKASLVLGCPDHRALALESARKSLVLLQNRHGTLPLDGNWLNRLAVIGPNADDDLEQLGDWSLGPWQGQGARSKHPRQSTVTILDGLVRQVGDRTTITYARGCDGERRDLRALPEAVRQAEAADAVVLVLGDRGMFVGEGKSTATLELQGGQNELLEAIAATGKPLIVVLINSKPLAIPRVAELADAVIEAFNPGMEGGTAIAELLMGAIEPQGRLTISFPVHVGQQPVFYSQMPGTHQDAHPDLDGRRFDDPLWAFGEGLLYTTIAYADLAIVSVPAAPGQPLVAEITVANRGMRPGSEVVQAYLRDLVTSVTWPLRRLVAWQRLTLAPGEVRRLRLEIPWERLALVDAGGIQVVEPGEFELAVGSSSRDRALGHRLRFRLPSPNVPAS